MSASDPEPWAQLHETHSGVVVLLGDAAYKVKKPVDLGFLDFSTREKRLAACRREVRLNRRLAPDVYTGVGDLVGPDGRPIEHVVMMRRLPASRRLSTLVRSGRGAADEVREVARRLAVFHAQTEGLVAPPRTVTVESLRVLWATSFTAMAEFGDVVPAQVESEIERLVERYLAGREDLFERRRVTGAVVDGHGDLMAEDIFCLEDGPRILDCLDFDDRLRVVDQVDDAAFLAMDLEEIGAPELGARFLEWYAEFSGDDAPASLVEHYVAYRAFVRAKVACVRHRQGHHGSAAEARRLADLALSHLERAAVKVVMVGGTPGTGKSTLAGALADRLGMTLLSSDRVRKELAGISPLSGAAAPWGEGIYSEQWTRRVDEELVRRATLLLRQGDSVVMDSTWSRQWRREDVRHTAVACAADLVELECRAPPSAVDERLRDRSLTGATSAAGSVSDAGVAVAKLVRESFEPWRSATVVDTSGTVDESLRAALPLVRPTGPRARRGVGSRVEPD